MPDGSADGALSKLLESIPTLFIVCGLILMALGIIGGVAYQNWLPIHDVTALVLMGLLGAGVFLLGLRLYMPGASRAPNASSFGVTIVSPRDADRVSKVDVRGTIKKGIPDGYALRVFRLYPGHPYLVPLSEATVNLRDQTWEALRCDLGGQSGDKRQLGAFLVGPGASILIDYMDKAADVHNEVSRQLSKTTGEPRVWLPPLQRRTPDMVECARVTVIRE
jgi:hypothetical protein